MSEWLQRKLSVPPLCARRGCWSPPLEDNCRCAKHAREHNEQQLASKVRRRMYRRRQLDWLSR